MDRIRKENLIRRFAVMVFGILFMGFGIALARVAKMGTDPYTCLNLGISGVLNISFGTWQLILNLVLIAAVFFYDKSFIGIATVVNMVGVGYVSYFFAGLYVKLFEDPSAIPLRLLLMAFAVVISGLSCAMYLAAKLGTSPYDCVAFIIKGLSKDKLSFRVARIIGDVTCVAVGFALGSIVGIGTVAMALLTGPLVQYFTKVFKRIWTFLP
jgi:uncharacterized membrane protein YczE